MLAHTRYTLVDLDSMDNLGINPPLDRSNEWTGGPHVVATLVLVTTSFFVDFTFVLLSSILLWYLFTRSSLEPIGAFVFPVSWRE